jgi:hypothetical protein
MSSFIRIFVIKNNFGKLPNSYLDKNDLGFMA